MSDHIVDSEKLSTLMKSKRNRIGLNKSAGECEMAVTTFLRIERGGVPDLGTFVKLCNWLCVSADQLLKTGKFVDKGNLTTIEAIHLLIIFDDDGLGQKKAEELSKAMQAVYDASIPD